MRDARSPLSEHIEGFFASKRKLAPKTREDYRRYLREFDEFTGNTDLETALTLDNAAAWITAVEKRGVFAARNACMALKSFASWAKKMSYASLPGGISVLAGLESPAVPKSSRNAIPDDQLEAIWATLADRPNHDRLRALAYIWLLLATGLRRNEARQLALKDLHIDPEGDRSWVHVRWQTSKGSKERRARLDSLAAAAIHEYISTVRHEYWGPKNQPEPLFTTQGGLGFTDHGFSSWLSRIFDDIEKATGIRWSSHFYRHTWATQFNRASTVTGLTAKDLMVEGGWSNIAIADRYMHERPWEEMIQVPSAISILQRSRMKGRETA